MNNSPVDLESYNKLQFLITLSKRAFKAKRLMSQYKKMYDIFPSSTIQIKQMKDASLFHFLLPYKLLRDRVLASSISNTQKFC